MPHDHKHHADIRIGTLANMKGSPDYIRQVLPHGFESFQLFFWQEVNADLEATAEQVLAVLGDKAVVSSLGFFGNPLQTPAHAEGFRKTMEACKLFHCDVVVGFAGALENRPLPESMPMFKKVWGDLAKRAEDAGVRIAFENCDMDGTWERPKFNIAFGPTAWEMMFNEVTSKAIGLCWEPCHQMVSLIDPLPQLRKWIGKIFHVHGKDATINWPLLREVGYRGGKRFVQHRTPGFGDTNWTDVISILRMNHFKGSIDIEGWHDPVYKDDLEMTGQVHALAYLKSCRGGAYVTNPVD